MWDKITTKTAKTEGSEEVCWSGPGVFPRPPPITSTPHPCLGWTAGAPMCDGSLKMADGVTEGDRGLPNAKEELECPG